MILGAICARGGSKGVPRKHMRPLGGRPLLAHTVECARAATCLDRLVLSTDDEEIAQLARSLGVEVPFSRPPHLAQDTSSKWDVFRHLVSTFEELSGSKVEVLVDLDVGCPLRAPEDVDACVRLLERSDADVVVTAYESERNPYFNMVEVDPSGRADLVKRLPQPVTGRQSAPAVYSLSPAVFAARRAAVFDFDHWSQTSLRIVTIPRSRGMDIDTELDFRLVECLISTGGAEA